MWKKALVIASSLLCCFALFATSVGAFGESDPVPYYPNGLLYPSSYDAKSTLYQSGVGFHSGKIAGESTVFTYGQQTNSVIWDSTGFELMYVFHIQRMSGGSSTHKDLCLCLPTCLNCEFSYSFSGSNGLEVEDCVVSNYGSLTVQPSTYSNIVFVGQDGTITRFSDLDSEIPGDMTFYLLKVSVDFSSSYSMYSDDQLNLVITFMVDNPYMTPTPVIGAPKEAFEYFLECVAGAVALFLPLFENPALRLIGFIVCGGLVISLFCKLVM